MNPEIQEITNKKERLQPAFYAVIPATVRYDKALPMGARNLYGEISSLCNLKGYCWAGNAYFAELYEVSDRTISNWITALKDQGHITVDFRYVSGKKEIETRIIRITCAEVVKKVKSDELPAEPPGFPENTQKIDNIDHIDGLGEETVGGEKIFNTYRKNFHDVVKISSKGDEKNCGNNNTSNIKNNTSSSSPPFDDPIPTVADITASEPEKEAEEVIDPLFTVEEIKQRIYAVDNALFYDPRFYSRVCEFMTKYNLDYNYIIFIYESCQQQNYNNIRGYFYSLFFLESYAEEYVKRREKSFNKVKKDLEESVMLCPCCNNFHSKQDAECPFCRLPDTYSDKEIELYKQLYEKPPEIRDEYLTEEIELSKNLFERKIFDVNVIEAEKNSLKQKYGILA